MPKPKKPSTPRLAPAPSVAPETWRALFAAADDFARLKPWEFTYDNQTVGLTDPANGETRIGSVLGNAGEVFAAVFYRRTGIRWILSMFSDSPDPDDLGTAEGMDCLKLEFVPRGEMRKEDLAALKVADYKPAGRGLVWPQFRSAEPGWHPWYINQAEADQLLRDLPRLTAFCQMFGEHPELFDERPITEIPFLPSPLPARPLTPEDLDWRPLLVPPSPVESFEASADQLQKLHALKRTPGVSFEFDSILLPGGSFVENGRTCFGRFSLLVETQRGLVLGVQIKSAALSLGKAVGEGLIDSLLAARALPEKLFIAGSRFHPILEPLCSELQIQLVPVSSLPALEEAVASLGNFMQGGGLPGS